MTPDLLAGDGVNTDALRTDPDLPTPPTPLTTIVTRGEDRAMLTGAGALTPVDAVGAGDTFDAGCLAAKLRGRSDQQELELAAVCGALSTLAAGGTTSQLTLADAVRYLEGALPG